jgi:hypothetical protein
MLPLESRVLDHPSLRTLGLRVFGAVSQQPHGAACGQCGHLVDAGHWIHEHAVVGGITVAINSNVHLLGSLACIDPGHPLANMSALPPIATALMHRNELTQCARSDRMHRSKWKCYSMTSSARPSRLIGKVMPSALAVLRLMMSSTFVDCTTGRSPGFSPLRIRPV